MFRYRVTKYDPRHRDVSGVFRQPDFSSQHDIGKVIGGHIVSVGDYLRAEDAYVEVVRQFLDVVAVQELLVSELEDKRTVARPRVDTSELRPTQVGVLQQGTVLCRSDVFDVVRLNLRELIWCKMVGDNGAYIHFGYDMYMYIGCDSSERSLGEPPAGIYFEEYGSPYFEPL